MPEHTEVATLFVVKDKYGFQEEKALYIPFTRKRLSWRIGQRPSSSDQGAHNSLPNAYAIRKIICPTLAALKYQKHNEITVTRVGAEGEPTYLLTDAEVLAEEGHRVGIQRGIEVHRDLDGEDDA